MVWGNPEEAIPMARRSEYHECICGRFFRADEDGETGEEHLTCSSQTRNTFAQGHDARLKGLLIRAGVAGQPAFEQSDGILISADPVTIARRFGFAHQVAAGIRRAHGDSRRRINKKIDSTPLHGGTARRTIKVGRWEYDALLRDNGDAVYVDRHGASQVRAAGTFRVLK